LKSKAITNVLDIGEDRLSLESKAAIKVQDIRVDRQSLDNKAITKVYKLEHKVRVWITKQSPRF
jgi:hypothetical protein